jgi:choline kinase
VFNEFLYQNKFVVEKHIKFIIETNTHKIYWVKKKYKATFIKNQYKKKQI